MAVGTAGEQGTNTSETWEGFGREAPSANPRNGTDSSDSVLDCLE